MIVKKDQISTVQSSEGIKIIKFARLTRRFRLFGLEKYIPWAWRLETYFRQYRIKGNIIRPKDRGFMFSGVGPSCILGKGWIFGYVSNNFSFPRYLDAIILTGIVPKGSNYFLSPIISTEEGQEIAAKEIIITGIKYLPGEYKWAEKLIRKICSIK